MTKVFHAFYNGEMMPPQDLAALPSKVPSRKMRHYSDTLQRRGGRLRGVNPSILSSRLKAGTHPLVHVMILTRRFCRPSINVDRNLITPPRFRFHRCWRPLHRYPPFLLPRSYAHLRFTRLTVMCPGAGPDDGPTKGVRSQQDQRRSSPLVPNA